MVIAWLCNRIVELHNIVFVKCPCIPTASSRLLAHLLVLLGLACSYHCAMGLARSYHCAMGLARIIVLWDSLARIIVLWDSLARIMVLWDHSKRDEH